MTTQNKPYLCFHVSGGDDDAAPATTRKHRKGLAHMSLLIDQERIEKAVVQQVVDYFAEEEKIYKTIREGISDRIEKVFAEHATDMVRKAVDDAVMNGFERQYQKVDNWGQKIGAPTSVKKELERLVGDYWSERVDSNGNKTESSYNSMSRAEFLMLKICADDFSVTMREHAINVTGALKDGLRNQLAKHMDSMLSELFRVKSLQDQGKVEKPY